MVGQLLAEKENSQSQKKIVKYSLHNFFFHNEIVGFLSSSSTGGEGVWVKVDLHSTLFLASNQHSAILTKSTISPPNTPGTAGGLVGRDRTLAVKSRKNRSKSFFFVKK